MMKITAHTVKSQTLFSILSLNATTLKLFMLKLLINAKFNCAFSPMSHEIHVLFGTDLNTSRNNELKLNYCLLFAKYYLIIKNSRQNLCERANIFTLTIKLCTSSFKRLSPSIPMLSSSFPAEARSAEKSASMPANLAGFTNLIWRNVPVQEY